MAFLHYKHAFLKGKLHSTHSAYVHFRKKDFLNVNAIIKKKFLVLSVTGICPCPLLSLCLLSQSSTFWPTSPITSSWMLTRCWPAKQLPWWVSADFWWPGAIENDVCCADCKGFFSFIIFARVKTRSVRLDRLLTHGYPLTLLGPDGTYPNGSRLVSLAPSCCGQSATGTRICFTVVILSSATESPDYDESLI